MNQNALLSLVVVAALVGCGPSPGHAPYGQRRLGLPGITPTPSAAERSEDAAVVVRARATFVASSSDSGFAAAQVSAGGSNASSSTMSISTARFSVPTLSNRELSLGYLDITRLQDNNLKVCGPGGTTKCTQAILRMYVLGASPGFYNAVESYSAPVFAGISALASVGNGAANAAILQTYTIPSSQSVLKLSDFSPAPEYEVVVDMTSAPAGAYAVTLVLEYGLGL